MDGYRLVQTIIYSFCSKNNPTSKESYSFKNIPIHNRQNCLHPKKNRQLKLEQLRLHSKKKWDRKISLSIPTRYLNAAYDYKWKSRGNDRSVSLPREKRRVARLSIGEAYFRPTNAPLENTLNFIYTYVRVALGLLFTKLPKKNFVSFFSSS